MFAAPHQAERRPLFIPGRPAFDPRTNLVRAETPPSHPAAEVVRRDVLRRRQRWQSALRTLDQTPA